MARPDIANQVRFRKEEDIRLRKSNLTAGGFRGEVRVLTSCPGCLQGLSRYEDAAGIRAEFLIVEMAKLRLGSHWLESFVQQAKSGGIEKVLV